MGYRYAKSDDTKKILYVDANNLYGWAMNQSLLYDEIEWRHGHPDLCINKLEEILNASVDSDIGFILEVDLRYSDNIKEKTKYFPFCPENKIIPKGE